MAQGWFDVDDDEARLPPQSAALVTEVAGSVREFCERIAAYYAVRGWEEPGTREQFSQAVSDCWDLEAVPGVGCGWQRRTQDA